MNKYSLFFLFLSSAFTGSVQAESLYHFGGGVGLGQFSVDDPDGSTSSASDFYIQGTMHRKVSRNRKFWRYVTDLSYRKFDLDYEPGKVGQSVSTLSLGSAIQRSIQWKDTRPYLGLGAAISTSRYRNRAIADNSGFLDQRLADTSSTDISLLLQAGIDIGSTENYSYGAKFQFETPLDTGINGVSGIFYIIMR